MLSKAPRPTARRRSKLTRGAGLLSCFLTAAAVHSSLADTITAARFTEPTTRYAHGVLGDGIEYGALELTVDATVTGENRRKITVRLPQDRVFEDLSPRMIDIDSDGSPEVIVVESHAEKGAQLAIYGAEGQKIAATPHIGTRYRWLAPVGAGDLDGDGFTEIAYVDRPHLAKTLRIWRFKQGDLTEIIALPDLTNHRIGEDYISGGLRHCENTPELILANGSWTRVISVTYKGKWIKSDLGPYLSPNSLINAMEC
ncbi:FG-GAP repeat domain-containing protein [Ruegeria arenilitoris]|uniref:FG-GAP repeat domain-containing protein n=1 Tax=Ruegeria arenilitoris TaxID=1173585 RepID=UPI00147EE8E5|nr:VCBS repeat-containing protein [Ruegeria arenilitoris]